MSPFELADLRILQGKFGIPVVLDLRDPWALDGWKSYRHVVQWIADKRRMKRALSEAAGVIMNTPEAAKAVLETFPQMSPERLTSIGNGYDPVDLATITKMDDDDERFTIVHCGTIHSYVFRPVRTLKQHASLLLRFRPEPIRPEGRTLKHLCGALKHLKNRNPALLQQLRVVLVGPYDDDTKAYLEQSEVQEFFQPLGYLNHSETMRWIKRADALFLPMHGLPTNRRSLIVPGKTYEYLASGKPILGAVPDGDAKDLLLQHPCAVIADPCNSADIADSILKLLSSPDLFRDCQIPRSLSRFRRDSIAEQFSTFFLHVLRLSNGSTVSDCKSFDAVFTRPQAIMEN